MIDFVRQTEEAQRGDAPPALDEAAVGTLAADFRASWKAAILRANSDVLRLFANFVNGMEVLKQVLTCGEINH